MNVTIVGCSRRKSDSKTPLPALDLYQGGCVPMIRSRVNGYPNFRSRVFILSAEYGLLQADDRIESYDRVLSAQRAEELRASVGHSVSARILRPFRPHGILVVVEPTYFILLADLLKDASRPAIHWIPDPDSGWPQAAAILDRWGWPA